MPSTGLSPREGGILWPSHTFVEAYNSHRFDVSSATSGAFKVPVVKGNKSARNAGAEDGDVELFFGADPASRTRTAPHGDGESYGYTLIRSDLENEQLDSLIAVPEISASSIGVRPRSSAVDLDGRHDDEGEIGGPMAWVDSAWFQGLSGLIISLNAAVIGLETDIETPLWFWVEESLLIFFVFELTVRLVKNGIHFFQHEEDWVWNLLDFSIVMSGVTDTWIVPCVTWFRREFSPHNQHGHGSLRHHSVLLMLMRMLRLLRIVRLFRLVRIVRPLFELAMGILEALQGMFWVLVFMLMTLYAAAILCTRLIGHGSMLDSDGDDKEELQEIKAMFSSVSNSIFTLFGTVSSWSLLRFVPLFVEMPYLRPLFLLFYVYSAWALLAVMTGVVSENMIAIREQMLQDDKQKDELRRANITEHLLEIFRNADTDGSGTISREEFEQMISNPKLIKKIHKNAHMRMSEMRELYDWLDNDGNGTITIDEFMAGFKWVNQPLRAKSLVKMQERVLNELRGLESSVVSDVQSRTGEVTRMVAQPLRKVYAVTEQLQSIEYHLSDLRIAMKEQAEAVPSKQDVIDTHSKLSSRLEAITSHVVALEAERNRTGMTMMFE